MLIIPQTFDNVYITLNFSQTMCYGLSLSESSCSYYLVISKFNMLRKIFEKCHNDYHTFPISLDRCLNNNFIAKRKYRTIRNNKIN